MDEDEYQALCGALELLAAAADVQAPALETLRQVAYPGRDWPTVTRNGVELGDVTESLEGDARAALDELERALTELDSDGAQGGDAWTREALVHDPRWARVRDAARACLDKLRGSLS